MVFDLHNTELALDGPEWVLHLRSDADIGLLQLIQDDAHGCTLVQRTSLARAHGNALVTLVGKHIGFVTVHQLACLCDVVDVGSSARRSMNQSRMGINANVDLPAEVSLIALFCLGHLGVAPLIFVFGRAGRGNRRGIDHCAFVQHQAFFGECGVGKGEDSSPPVFGSTCFASCSEQMDSLSTAAAHEGLLIKTSKR